MAIDDLVAVAVHLAVVVLQLTRMDSLGGLSARRQRAGTLLAVALVDQMQTFVPRLLQPGKVTFVGVVVAVLLGCQPGHPSCVSDVDCHAHEFCVARKCQQCRQAADCPLGQRCGDGKCTAIPGYCRLNAECSNGNLCIENQCRLCGADTECPPDRICHQGACKNAQRCSSDRDCAQNEDCRDSLCIAATTSPSPASCKVPSIFFDFNESILTSESRAQLADAVTCLKESKVNSKAVGHADPRGTQEFNMALSERRARAVREHLERLGIGSDRIALLPRGSIDAKGTDEPSWAHDRRVELLPE
jgi:peptidoglycan-associated lipoprotein